MERGPERKPFENKRVPAWLGCPLFGISGACLAFLATGSIRDGLPLVDSVLSAIAAAAALLVSVVLGAELCRSEARGTEEQKKEVEANQGMHGTP